MTDLPNIVLVHGACAEGSCWEGVIERLQDDHYHVTAPQLLAQGPPTPALAHLDIDDRGLAWLPEDDFVGHFAADVEPAKAKAMFAVQQPLAASTLQDVMGPPAWKSYPSWYMVAANDEAIPPAAERQFASRMDAVTVEIPSSHLAMVSHPDDVARFIETAAPAIPTPVH